MADLIPTAATVLPQTGSRRAKGQAGEAIAQGETLYRNEADGKLYLAIDTSAVTAEVVGIALTVSAADQPVIYLASGQIDLSTTVVVGTVYVQSASGNMAPITDHFTADWVTTMGVAVTAAILDVSIQASGVQVPA